MTPTKLPPSNEVEIPGLENLKKYLESRVIGQPRPIKSIVRSFGLGAVNLHLSWRPISVLFFAGPTGVGKTEMGLALSDYLFYQEQKIGLEKSAPPLIKIDSSLFGGSLHFNVTELVGSAAGYVGSKDSNSPRKPRLVCENFPPDRITVLLWDEIEKALANDSGHQNQEILGILIAILDKGELRNNWDEEVVNFKRSVIILTSNIAAQDIVKTARDEGIGFHPGSSKNNRGVDDLSEEQIREINEKIYEISKRGYERSITAELRNRIDRFIVFRFLTRTEYTQILNKELGTLEIEVRSKLKVGALKISDAAKEWFLRYGIVRELGVRSLQRSIAKKLRDPLSIYHLAHELSEGCTVYIDVLEISEKSKFEFNIEK